MSTRDVVTKGWTRVRAEPALGVLAYGLGVVLVVPLAAVMYAILRASLGRGMSAERMRVGWDDLWFRGFCVERDDFAGTFDPSLSGIGAPLHAIDDLTSGALFALPASLVAAGLAYVVVWVFVSGGLIARYARPLEPTAFLTAAASAFPRVLVVAGVGWLAYALVLTQGLMLREAVVDAVLYDEVDERLHIAWSLGTLGVIWLVMLGVNVVVEQTRVAAVLDPAVGIAGWFRRGVGVVTGRATTVLGITAVAGVAQTALLGAYAVIAPGVSAQNGFQILIAGLIAQTYVVGRVALRCWGLANHTVLAVSGTAPDSREVTTRTPHLASTGEGGVN